MRTIDRINEALGCDCSWADLCVGAITVASVVGSLLGLMAIGAR